jgi:4-nitrophenyl phosphatase
LAPASFRTADDDRAGSKQLDPRRSEVGLTDCELEFHQEVDANMAERGSKRVRTSAEDEDGNASSKAGRKSIDALKESMQVEQQKRLEESLGRLKQQKQAKESPAKKPQQPEATRSSRTPSESRQKSSSAASSSSSPSNPSVAATTSSAAKPSTSATPSAAPMLRYSNFILDCDGVIWHGPHAIPGSIEGINQLRGLNCNFHFVTNSSGSSRRVVAQKLRDHGLKWVEEEMVTTSGSAAAWLIMQMFPRVKRVHAIGETGLFEELRRAKFQVSGDTDVDLTARNEAEFHAIPVDDGVQLVVCGLDRSFSYGKLARASLYLQRRLPLICTNLDAFDVLPSKGNVPGAGCIAAALIASHPTVKPLVAGKPSGEMLLNIMNNRGFDKAWTVMVGDRVDTDIECAHNAGIASCLVLSGVSKQEHAESATLCFKDLGSFLRSVLS